MIFGLASAGASVYGMAETKGNYDYNKKEVESSEGKSAKMAELDQAVFDDYAKALGREVVGAWAAGLLAVVLGVVAAKKGAKGLGLAAILLGLAGAGMAFAIMPQPIVM